MKPYVLSKLKEINKRYEEIQLFFTDNMIFSDKKRFREISCEYEKLKEIYRYFSEWKNVQNKIEITKTILNDPEMYEIVKEELFNLNSFSKAIEKKLEILLFPKNPDDNKNVFIEICAGTGGNEAAIFAHDLFRMYQRYAESYGWNVDILSIQENEKGGYKEIIAKIIGKGVYGKLKFESGSHRVQRVPFTESQGRTHTSTCLVAVIPEIPEEKIKAINPADLRIDTFRSSGAGGQHVNTTDSAVRITHLPTKIIVECQDERSQHKNKSKALSILSTRIYENEMKKKRQEESSIIRNLIGSGARNDRRNRTYNFSQKRVTDHRINLTLYRLDEILAGKLDMLIEPIYQKYCSNYDNFTEKKNEFSILD